ncbi:uncharacterized protein LOC135712791 [Ochlerotatus camptorhynchus]|uniref:uncharacterized protein LOC135712791 n=1 Tax=Ochlerotatus camptorhynchus TaxID=644619 RepID=UPI0031E2EBA9
MMEFFAYLVANKASTSKTINIRRVYVNEDPNTEETEPCPKCMARNHQSTVRYMYVNLQEAIYKCESPFCMYPFQNFKFKNYTDNTVYYYSSAAEETPLEDFSTTFTNVPSPFKGAHEGHQSVKASPPIAFNMHFLSPEHSHADSKLAEVSPGLNIFDSPSLSYKNLIQDFDTGFIDDILQDLSQPSPEKKSVLVSPVRVVQNDPSTTNRQLKRCLQMFKDSSASTEVVFKVPPLPGSEVPSSPKIKSKKLSPLRRHKHVRRTHHSNSSSVDKVSRKCRMKPLDFIETMNSIQPKEAPPAEPRLAGVKPLSNQKVERMLNFIERSMKKREPTPEATVAHVEQPPKRSIEQPVKKHRIHRQTKRLSLSAAVLQDSKFDYSTSESEQEDISDSVPSPFKSVNSGLGSLSQLPSENDQNHSLPSFENLLMHIHPVQPQVQPYHNIPAIGFRSAESSPTRVQQWEKTPPRRIHSMGSLNSLLE